MNTLDQLSREMAQVYAAAQDDCAHVRVYSSDDVGGKIPAGTVVRVIVVLEHVDREEREA